MPPICLSWVEEDLLLILQTHLQGVQNADQKARQDEVYLIKKTAPEVTGNHSEEEIAFDHVTSREGRRGRGGWGRQAEFCIKITPRLSVNK